MAENALIYHCYLVCEGEFCWVSEILKNLEQESAKMIECQNFNVPHHLKHDPFFSDSMLTHYIRFFAFRILDEYISYNRKFDFWFRPIIEYSWISYFYHVFYFLCRLMQENIVFPYYQRKCLFFLYSYWWDSSWASPPQFFTDWRKLGKSTLS